jgi:sulfur dioxygenase
MKIEQLFDPATSTYSYLLWDEKTRQAALIDSVTEQVVRDATLIRQLGLALKYALETHIHADHITGSGLLRQDLGCQVAVHENSKAECADILLADGDALKLGEEVIDIIHTPGHTDTDISYRIPGAVFTGDALLVNGCGRTDFQSGDATALYHSITEKLFTLDDNTVVYPGHDYHGFTSTTIGREKRFNPRLGNNRSEEEFVAIMNSLILDPPARIHTAVPGNQHCGLKVA